MKTLPLVALIGQTNAGKSSLLNRFAHKNIAITAREAGTTRDSVSARIDDRFVLVDTAGLKAPTDEFEASIQEIVEDAISSAELILVTLDSTKYFSPEDARIAKNALRSKKPVFLLLNKSDLKESLPIEDFRALGIAPERTFYVSATTGQGTRELKDAILKELPAPVRETDATTTARPLKLALIGRPNVGKSSLFNALSKKQQALVSSRQGVTRDVNRVSVKFHGREIEILDTAGLRRAGRREVGIEKFSALRTLSAIEEADVCALLIDSTEPHVKLDQALAGEIIEAGKGIIMVVTKTDLLTTPEVEEAADPADPSDAADPADPTDPADALLDRLENDFDFLPYAPVLLTSSQTGKNITRLFSLALEVDANRHTEIKTSDLNKILADAIASHPPAGLKNTHPKPKYIVQTDVCPPWFVVHGRELGLLHWSWRRFLERKLRESFPLVGTPVRFSFRSDDKKKDA